MGVLAAVGAAIRSVIWLLVKALEFVVAMIVGVICAAIGIRPPKSWFK